MDAFLRKHPAYKEEAEFLGRIKEGTVYDQIGRIQEHCSVLDVDGLKELLEEEDPARSRIVRKTLKKMATREPEGVEKMAYRVLSRKTVNFTDINTKILFYREFWALRRYFRNGTDAPSFVMAELLYLRVYHRKDVSEHVAGRMFQLPFLDKVFYFMVFAGLIKSSVLLDLARDIETACICDPGIDYRLIAMSFLPEHLYYRSVSTYLLYSAPVDRLKIIRSFDPSIDAEKLALAMLSECFSSPIGVENFYVEYLRIIRLLALSRGYKIKLLYAWMRYFLAEKMTGQFRLLLERVERAAHPDAELEFYRAFSEYLDGKTALRKVSALAKKLKDDNCCARHSIEQILDAYACK